ncbi:hypothetical protein GCM10023340_02710 [Nocardioides marinquilinus]|uniref:Bacterial Ig-like domain-containing protein n=1 Tax=Nocardioides marinquilinus TaxID=1210400 RepID=A0ABP9P918_9ACTN
MTTHRPARRPPLALTVTSAAVGAAVCLALATPPAPAAGPPVTAQGAKAPAPRATADLALVGVRLETGPTDLAAESPFVVTVVPVLGGGSKPAPGTIRVRTTDDAVNQTLPVDGRSASFALPPGDHALEILYSGGNANGDTWLPSGATVPVHVDKATLTHTTDLPPGLHVDRFDPLALGVTPVSSASHLRPHGDFALFAFGPDGVRHDLALGAFDGPGRLAFDARELTEVAGSYDLYFTTSEVDWFETATTKLGTVVVDPARIPTSVTLGTPSGTVAYGSDAARLTGAVVPRRAEGPIDGTLQVLVDGRRTGTPVPVRSDAPVSLPLTSLAPGTYAVKVAYSGGTSHAASDSRTATLTVAPASTATSIATRSVPSGGRVTVRVAATDSSARGTGTVTLREGSSVVASGAVRDGVAALSLPARLAAGRHLLTAAYSGSTTHRASTSPATAVVVGGPAASRITGRVTRQGRTVVGAVTVASSQAPTGRVQVLDGSRVVRTLTLRAADRGRVAFRLTGLAPGSHRITVRYLGSPQSKAASKAWTVSVPR